MLDTKKLYDYFKGIDFDRIIKQSVLKSENDMLTLNENQMLLQGEDSEGNKLQTYKAAPGEVYAEYTIAIKKEQGKRTDIVTLHDSGYFHKSMKLYKDSENLPLLVNGTFPIIADFKKGSENIGDNIDTSNVLGLNNQNTEVILKDVQNEILQTVSSIFQQAPKL